MKKALLLGLMLLVTFSVFAQEAEKEPAIDFHLNFTNIGLGMFLPFDGIYIVEMSFELLQFGIDLRGSGINIYLSPFTYYGWFGEGVRSDTDDSAPDLSSTHSFSFLNFGVSWSFLGLLGITDSSFLIAPFVHFSYLFMEQELNTDRYVFAAGVKGGIRGGSGRVRYNIFTVETGLRLIEGTSKFFIGVKYDPMMHWFNTRRIN